MAMFDRLRTTNSIEAVQQAPAPAPEPARQEPRVSSAAPAVAAAPPEAPTPTVASQARDAAKLAKAPAYASEPEAISRAYYVEDRGSERRYFDDYKRTALAIRADDTSINSKREDLNTIRAMLTMAESKGWAEIKVSGTAEFKREAWIEAAARGINAQGYKAGDLDRQEADRRRDERGPEAPRPAAPEGNEVRRAAPTPQPGPDATQARSASPEPTALRPAASEGIEPRRAAPAPQPGPDATQARSAPEPIVLRPATVEGVGVGVGVGVGGQEAKDGPAPAKPTRAENFKAARESEAALSDHGRLVFAAISSNIDRKMYQLNADGKAELKAFTAAELVNKERIEGPIVLTKEQIQLAKGPASVVEMVAAERAVEAPKQVPKVVRQGPEPEQDRPRRARSR